MIFVSIKIKVDSNALNQLADEAMSQFVEQSKGICIVCEKPIEPVDCPSNNVVAIHPQCASELE